MSLNITPSPFGSLSVSVAETNSTLQVGVLATSPCELNVNLGVPGPKGDTGAQGPAGTNGTNGTNGSNGVGVPVGGSVGQALVKLSGTNYDTGWSSIDLSSKLSLTGGTMVPNAFINFSSDVYPEDPFLNFTVNDGESADFGGSIRGDGFRFYDNNGDLRVLEGGYYNGFTHSNDDGLSVNLNFQGITFNDNTVQSTAGLALTSATTQTVSGANTLFQNYVAIQNVSGFLDVQRQNNNGARFLVSDFSTDYEELLSRFEITPYEIIFPDATTQTTAGLTLTGGTLTGDLNFSGAQLSGTDADGGNFSFSSNWVGGTFDGSYWRFGIDGLRFWSDGSIQTTAFPPSGGTTAQYIDGTGALQTFPTVSTAGKMVTSIRNNTGATLTKGTVVYISGAVGNKPTVTKSQANSEASSKATFGLVEANIANNADGNVIQFGLLENIDTTGYTDGTQIFLSPTTAGGWTSTQPFSPYHYVRIGTIIRGGHPTLGSISVNIINGFQLDEMSDVGAVSPTNNNVLTWVSSSSQWLDRSISTILGYTPANVANYSYATTAQAQAGTSTTTVINPATLREMLMTANVTKLSTGLLAGTSGTGGQNDGGGYDFTRLGCPNSAAGVYTARYRNIYAQKGSSLSSNLAWGNGVALYFRLSLTSTTGSDPNSTGYIGIGENTFAVATLPTVRSIGVQLNHGSNIKIVAHNGTTLTTYTTSTTVNSLYLNATDFLITNDYATGTVTLYINGVSAGSTTGGVTTELSSFNGRQQFGARAFNASVPSGSQLGLIVYSATAIVL